MARLLLGSPMLMTVAFSCTLAIFCQSPRLPAASGSAKPAATPLVIVPSVGCAADGQVGPLAPPKVEPKRLPLSEAVAAQLAYYKAEQGPGVLGPRGWSCFETYGSNGSSLFLTPGPLDPKWFFAERRNSLSEPAIQYSGSVGDTSGRFEVARMAARVFPHFRPFVNKIIAEGIEPASDFPSGPFPADKLVYRSNHLVEFVTPANATGLGTQSFLAEGAGDVSGFATIFGDENDMFHLSMRLPPALATLGPVIMRQAEREAAQQQP